MTTLNLKSVASAFGALALTMFLSFAVAATSNYVPVQHGTHSGFLAAIVALVR